MVPIDRIQELTGEHVFYREQDHSIVSGSGHGPRGSTRGASEPIRDKNPKKKSGRGSSRPLPRPRPGNSATRIRVRAERIDPIRRRVEFSPLP